MRKLIGIVLAACLVFVLAAGAYAANLFGLGELFRTAHRELPEAAVPYIQQETVAARAEDLSCAITESLSDDSNVMATVTLYSALAANRSVPAAGSASAGHGSTTCCNAVSTSLASL